jgi:TPR repeat protein
MSMATRSRGRLGTMQCALAGALALGCGNGSGHAIVQPASGSASAAPAPGLSSAPPAAAPAPIALVDERALRARCDGGDPAACAGAARALDDGWGVERDPLLASWYAGVACAGGDARGCLHRAELLHELDRSGGRMLALELAAYAAKRGVAEAKGYFPSWPQGPASDDAKLEAIGCGGGSKWPCVAGLEHAPAAVVRACAAGKPAACAAAGSGEESALRAAAATSMREPCRREGRGCGLAEGETAVETLAFRRRACFEAHDYAACADYTTRGAGREHTITIERAYAQACLHGAGRLACGRDLPLAALEASTFAEDRALRERVRQPRAPDDVASLTAACGGARVDPWFCVDYADPLRGAPAGETGDPGRAAAACPGAIRAYRRVCELGASLPKDTPARDVIERACGRRPGVEAECRKLSAQVQGSKP